MTRELRVRLIPGRSPYPDCGEVLIPVCVDGLQTLVGETMADTDLRLGRTELDHLHAALCRLLDQADGWAAQFADGPSCGLIDGR